jgi:hypothetical protein
MLMLSEFKIAQWRMWSCAMLRFLLVLTVIAAVAAAGAWIAPPGLPETLLKSVVGIDVVILLFVGFIAMLQWMSPAETDDTA